MQKHLYFVCPVDHLESVIDKSFKHKNYYYTSLGNSVVFDEDTIHYIKRLISKHNIGKISFVLSNNNPIISDALGNQFFSDIRGLNTFYDEIKRQKRYSDVLWQKNNRQFTILSHFLNKKIKELQLELNNLNFTRIEISGKIYSKDENVFHEIYSDLICGDYFSLN